MSDSNIQFDYIIVGVGLVGGVMVVCFLEDFVLCVLFIEVGSKDINFFIYIFFGLFIFSWFEGIGWGYYMIVQGELYDCELFWFRGKILGGSSLVNVMCYIWG